jgi:hypothetical protein
MGQIRDVATSAGKAFDILGDEFVQFVDQRGDFARLVWRNALAPASADVRHGSAKRP